MEQLGRTSFQGVTNIIRFNWHYYIIALLVITVLSYFQNLLPFHAGVLAKTILVFTTLNTLISLAVSFYIYDYSNLYSFNWLNNLAIGKDSLLVNINAGFDETSLILSRKYPDSKLVVFDFYDAEKHTEISIERARKAYPSFPNTKKISTNTIPLEECSINYIFLLLSAHEIRNEEERIDFFNCLSKTLVNEGKIVVVEHLRDFNNFIAFNFGFFHFYSNKNWRKIFNKAGLSVHSESKLTPFISTFILSKNGVTF
jgi:hypothetical protein